MPHTDIKHFPTPLNEDQKIGLADDLASMTTSFFGCDTEALSIAREPVATQDWGSQVNRLPTIDRSNFLEKMPFPAHDAATQTANSGSR